MNTQQIDMTKVKVAVQKYCLTIKPRTEHDKLPPIDSGLRKPLKGPSKSCKGFYHKDFLHGI